MNTQTNENDLYRQQCKVVQEICQLKLLNEKLASVRMFKEKLKGAINATYNNTEEISRIEQAKNQSTDLIDFVLKNMTPFNSWLIKNAFMTKNEQLMGHWYEEYFSKTTYYKKKKEAINEFMALYFDYKQLQL
ncbi:MG284/MPN403 family protein [Mycoplasma crocodyli]|uniref:Uncharacterized protein n=1 Tax=Mycoplasma crocodyli (strain ATCC 51981 / MP145) TaxID=512564 RepID=D5E684_MYCCM|nr:hypothetical protein [Mycoplasma crocodyli]ADE19470.1 conserved hypothetical protein [Mycoplasma crocodyli MP145]